MATRGQGRYTPKGIAGLVRRQCVLALRLPSYVATFLTSGHWHGVA